MEITKKYFIEGKLLNEGTKILMEGDDGYENLIIKSEGDTTQADQVEIQKFIDSFVSKLESKGVFEGQNDKATLKKDVVDYLKGVMAETTQPLDEDKVETEVLKYIQMRSPGFAK